MGTQNAVRPENEILLSSKEMGYRAMNKKNTEETEMHVSKQTEPVWKGHPAHNSNSRTSGNDKIVETAQGSVVARDWRAGWGGMGRAQTMFRAVEILCMAPE